tara:strand:+ start:483 stop:677 length:195 start_codon:yes stop_codon:yes gene_type:complete
LYHPRYIKEEFGKNLKNIGGRKMKDKIFMMLLGIIAVNLTIQTVRDVGLFPTAHAQNDVQKVQI